VARIDELTSGRCKWGENVFECLRCSRRLWAALGISLASHAWAMAWLQKAWGNSQSSDLVSTGSFQGFQVSWHNRDFVKSGPDEGWSVPLAASASNRLSHRSATGTDAGPMGPSLWNIDGMKLIWRSTGLPVPAPTVKYLDATSVDQIAQPIDVGNLSTPAEDGAGHVILVLLISADGRVDGAAVESSDLPDSFVEATLQAFRDARFIPARQAGQAVPMRYRIEASYGYSLLNDEHDPPPPLSGADASEKK
jgi:hypothetical protein